MLLFLLGAGTVIVLALVVIGARGVVMSRRRARLAHKRQVMYAELARYGFLSRDSAEELAVVGKHPLEVRPL